MLDAMKLRLSTVVAVGTLLAACAGREAPPLPPATPTQASGATPTPTQASGATPTPAPAGTAAPPGAPFVRPPGFDLRGTVQDAGGTLYVIARGPLREAATGDAHAGDTAVHARVVSSTPSGEPVRILGPRGACDGTLGARVELTAQQADVNDTYQRVFAHAVVGCRDEGWLAIVDPPPLASLPVSLPATAPEAQPAVEAARAAAARVGRLPSGPWLPPKVVRLGDAIYALVAGPVCPDGEVACTTSVGAVARVRAGQPAEVLLARPSHFVWEPAMDGAFDFAALTDVDGDGTIEVLEHMRAEQGVAYRLVRPGARAVGDVAWLLVTDAQVPFPARVGAVPPPIVSAIEQP